MQYNSYNNISGDLYYYTVDRVRKDEHNFKWVPKWIQIINENISYTYVYKI